MLLLYYFIIILDRLLSAKRDIKEQDILFVDAHGRLEIERCLEYCLS
jgi:hypothetical protein